MRIYGYVYETKNLVNGKFYVGQKKAVSLVRAYLGSGNLIQAAVKKYGKESFSVKQIGLAENKESLDFLECFFVQQYTNRYGKEMMYNIHPGGKGGSLPGGVQRQWAREKISRALRGRIVSEETRHKTSRALKGRIFSADHRRRISRSRPGKIFANARGLKRTLETRLKISRALKGRQRHPKTTAALIKFHVGSKRTPQTKERMRQAWVLRREKDRTPIIA